MDCVELSDLEDGEILEYESLSPSDTKSDDNEIKSRPFELLQKEDENGPFRIKGRNDDDIYLTEKRKIDNTHCTLKKKLKLSKKLELKKSNISMVDLESISSEEESKSDMEEKYFSKENNYYISSNKDKKTKRKHSALFYGTVEDIMSEIGETICRKSHCNYRKKKSKDLQCHSYKYSDSSYDLWRSKIFSSHLKHKKHKRKISSDSDSEFKREKRRRRRKKEVHYEEVERETKKRQINDFDEMRRNLLEKLKKKKAEEKSEEQIYESTIKVENSEIQEVDMLIDCTNYVDNPPDLRPENSTNEEWTTQEKNGEEELDLIELRLIALASNKKRKDGKDVLEAKKLEDVSEKKKFSEDNRVDVDFDRNELLLRAEALKTALLKKHQKRLNKTKANKINGVESLNGSSTVNFSPSSVEESTKKVNLENDIGNLDPDAFKENMESKGENGTKGSCSDVSSAHVLDLKMKINEISKSPVISNVSPKKLHKRKKRKSGSFSAVNYSEKSEKSEILEEDDRTLRSQLLSDLMKKKSLKDSEKKSVLMDSVQTSTNKQPFSIMSCATSKENTKPLPAGKRNLLKKINNAPKKTKPKVMPSIPNPEIQRIIVHLGSEESTDEDEVSSQALHELNVEKKESSHLQEQEIKGKESDLKSAELGERNNDKVVQAAYERSVELLLNQARRKIEGRNRAAKEGTLATPEAVYKHLPPSQRLEYLKLKQKIAEREKLKNQKKEFSGSSAFASIGPQSVRVTTNEKESVKGVSQKLVNLATKADHESANSSSNSTSVDNINGDLSRSEVISPFSSNANTVHGFVSANEVQTKESSQRFPNNKIESNLAGVCKKDFKKSVAHPDKEGKVALPDRRNTLLLPSSQALLNKLKLLLKKIKIEKTIEENYEKEISKLKNQLSLFEKKKSEQRSKIKKLGEESMKTYNAIQRITAKFNEKSVPEKDLVDGKSGREEKNIKVLEEKKEDEGLIVPKEPDKEINKGQSKLDNELNNDDQPSEAVVTGTSSSVSLQEYKSPLQAFNKVSDCTEKVDPNVMMCQFDLLGICKDDECVYQHLRGS